MNNNEKKTREAEIKILEVLSDGKWHQAKDLKTEVHVSSKTLYKHLEKIKTYIEEHEDRESGKYPYPKYYRANKALMEIISQIKKIDSAWKRIKERFLKTKDLAFALEQINAIDNLNMVFTLIGFHENNPPQDIIDDLLYIFVWKGHEILTGNLTKTCLEVIDSINFENVLEDLIFKKEKK